MATRTRARNQVVARQAQPCRFTVRYVLVPQHLMHGDVLGPLPIAPLTTHGYSVDVGGYDVLRFSFRRIGANLTFACLTDGIEDCSVSRGGVVGTSTHPSAPARR